MKMLIGILILLQSGIAMASPLRKSQSMVKLAFASLRLPEESSISTIQVLSKGVRVEYGDVNANCLSQFIPMIFNDQDVPLVPEAPLPPAQNCASEH